MRAAAPAPPGRCATTSTTSSTARRSSTCSCWWRPSTRCWSERVRTSCRPRTSSSGRRSSPDMGRPQELSDPDDSVSGTGGDRVDVSVLTPVLNEAAYIEAAARAMLAQRFDGEVEFLFIDGRSDDDTVARLERLAEQDERIGILDNPQRSTPIALNIGL